MGTSNGGDDFKRDAVQQGCHPRTLPSPLLCCKQSSLSYPYLWFCAKWEPLARTSLMRARGVAWVGKFLAMEGRVRV